jgi:hypothetical protein
MKIAIVGGTGALGRHVVSELRARGHEVRALSRNAPGYPVDLTTGTGLDEALSGCEVVVDVGRRMRTGTDRLFPGQGRAGDRGGAGTAAVDPGPRDPVPRLCRVAVRDVGYARQGPFQMRMALVNSAPELIVRDFGGVLSVIALTIDAGRITAFDVVRDPDKLAGVSLPPEDQRER